MAHDNGFLAAALIGYESERQRVIAAIEDIRRRLGMKRAAVGVSGRRQKRHRISPEGRARIAEAQRRRWAAKKVSKARSAAG